MAEPTFEADMLRLQRHVLFGRMVRYVVVILTVLTIAWTFSWSVPT